MDKVLSEMAKIADEVIKAYKTDFTNWDVQSYGRMYEGTKFIWLAREHGTYILGIPSEIRKKFNLNDEEKVDPRLVKPGYEMTVKEYVDYIKGWGETIVNHYGGENARYFMVVKGESIKPITREKALEIVME